MASALNKTLLRKQLKSEAVERIDWELYSAKTMAASSTQTLEFFQDSVSIGENFTNMSVGGQLPSPQSFLCYSVEFKLVNLDGTPFFFAGGAGPTIHPANVIWNRGRYKIKINPSDEYFGHLSRLHTQIDYVNDTAATLGVAALPASNYSRVLKFSQPLLFMSGRNFSVSVTVTTPAAAQGFSATNTYMYVYMKGLLRRNA